MTTPLVSYKNKTVLIVGGATGMGAAAAKLVANLGANIIVLDVADVDYPVQQSIKVDLRDKNSVDSAISSIDGSIDTVFACAGVADGTKGIMQINFISQRYIVEQLVKQEALSTGGSVVMISSVAGLPWQLNIKQVMDFLGTDSWETAESWLEKNDGNDTYMFSKQAVNGYIAASAFPMLKKGIRVNGILPGPTDTPLARANAETWLGFGNDYREAAGVGYLTAEQMGNTMAFLGSDAASGISGVTLLVDLGHVGAAITDAHPEPAVKMMLGMQ